MEDLEGCIVPIMLTLLCSNPTTGAGPPPQLQGFTNFFVPACDDLQPGDAAIVIVHGGETLHYAMLTWLDWTFQ